VLTMCGAALCYGDACRQAALAQHLRLITCSAHSAALVLKAAAAMYSSGT
jgi:hypothetical protein